MPSKNKPLNSSAQQPPYAPSYPWGSVSIDDVCNLEPYNPTLPSDYAMPNVKLLNVASEVLEVPENFDEYLEITNQDLKPLDVGGNTATLCRMFYLPPTEADNVILKSGYDLKLTEFDRAVFGAIASLYKAGNRIMTIATIYRVMTGTQDSGYIGDSQRKQVMNSISKMRCIYVEVDCSEEAQRIHKDDTLSVKYEAHFLETEILTVESGGSSSVKAYFIKDEPVLARYANYVNQVIQIPFNLLSVGGSNSAERIAIRFYLLRRILANTGKMANIILYTSIYEVADTGTDKFKREKARSFVHKCLEAWQRLGLLKSYEITCTPNGAYYSIKFVPNRLKTSALDNKTGIGSEDSPTTPDDGEK